MNLLLMALIACGGNSTQEANNTETEDQSTTTENAEVAPTPVEAEKKEVAKTSETKPASDEETQETTDQTVNTDNNVQNNTEE